VPGDREDPAAVRHDDVLALPNNLETCLLECADRIQVRDVRQLGHYTVTSTSRTSAPFVCSATTDKYS
jgi:hypothetical protein